MSHSHHGSPSLLKSIAAGAVGGLCASYAMNLFQALLSAAINPPSVREKPKAPEPDDVTVKAATAIAETLFHHHLDRQQKQWAGPAVHYALGTSLGGVYGALASTVPAASTGAGSVYGTAVWLVADETAVPAFGLAPPAMESPLSSHVSALASHLVYGLVTATVRRILLR